MSAAKEPGRPRGRPTDPSIEARVARAALEVYGEVGWAGFTFDALSARAGVGRGALYRRWETKADILASAWAAHTDGFVEVPDTGSLRGDLLELARALLERLDSPVGVAEIRLMLDTKLFADEFPHLDATRLRSRDALRSGVNRAVERGELSPDVSPELVFDAVRGTIIHNYLFITPGKEHVWRARRDAFAHEVVDVVLAGLASRFPRPT